jgi:hypothetical protein
MKIYPKTVMAKTEQGMLNEFTFSRSGGSVLQCGFSAIKGAVLQKQPVACIVKVCVPRSDYAATQSGKIVPEGYLFTKTGVAVLQMGFASLAPALGMFSSSSEINDIARGSKMWPAIMI